MKNILCFILCAILCAGLLTGCSETPIQETTAPQSHSLQVGYSRTDISPETPVPLSGYSNYEDRISTEVTEPLGAACIAFTDEAGNTVLLFHLDLSTCDEEIIGSIRRSIAKKHDIPVSNVQVSATHTHSGPAYSHSNLRGIPRYLDLLRERMIQAAEEAMADRKPATMHTATAYPKDLNWIRYYNLSDGTYGSGGLEGGVTRVSHLRETDNQLQMIKFVREGGKDVVLVNWQGHPHRDGDDDKTNVSADLVGAMRTFLEEEMDCKFAYFTGASGNSNNHSYLPGVTTTADYVEHGQALGQYVLDAEFKQVNAGPVKLVGQVYEAERIEREDVDIEQLGPISVPMFAFSVGDVAFVTAPYEMFDTSGQAIKEGSPYAMTFVATCSNASLGYFPTAYAFGASQCYETSITRVAPGTAEIMEKEYVRMLNELNQLP